MTEASQRNKPFSYFHLFLSAYSFVVLGFLLIGSRRKCGEPLLRWTNRAYDPTLTIRKHLDTEQTRVSLDLNSPRAGISSGRVGGKLVTLMRSSSAEHGQLWWNRISDSGCVAVQTGLLLLLKVVSRSVLKRRRAPLKKRRRAARSEQKFPFVGTSFWSTILFVGLCSSSPHNFSADVNTINAEYVSVCGQTICLSFTVHRDDLKSF